MAIMSFGMITPNLIQEGCDDTSDYFTLLERKPEIDTPKIIVQPDYKRKDRIH